MATVPSSNRASHTVVWGVALILVVLAAFAIRSLTREEVSVGTAKVTYQDLVKSLPTNGKVELTDDFEAHAQAAGQVLDIYVDAGQKVKPNQLLLRMDDKYALASLAHAKSSLETAQAAAAEIEQGGTQDERNSIQADLSRAQSQEQQDKTSLDAIQKLQQQGAAAPAEVSAAQRRLAMDEANIHTIEQRATNRYGAEDRARVQAQVDDARAAVTAAQRTYDTADIRSPIGGTVYDVSVSQYDYVDVGSELIYVADLSQMRIIAYFDEPDVGYLAVGQPVKITWEAEPGKAWFGHVVQVPTTIKSYLTRFVGECYIAIDNPDPALQPNANVNVVVTTAQRPHVLTIPHDALKGTVEQPYVFRIIDNRLVQTKVVVGLVNRDQVEIKSGLSEGDVVATTPTTPRDLTNGLEVKTGP